MQGKKRLDYLDSIRGIAAFIVVTEHCWMSKGGEAAQIAHASKSLMDVFLYVLTKLFNAGRGSVITFFVLSGFVLAASLLKSPTGYLGYAVKRILRIYPAFLFAIVLSYALHVLIGVRYVPSSEYLQKLVNVVPSPAMLFKHIAMLGTPGGKDLDAVVWTLIHEMRISLVFPLVLMAVSKYSWKGVAGTWVVSAALAFAVLFLGGNPQGYEQETILLSLMESGAFVVFFAAGAYVMIEREAIAALVSKIRPRWQILLSAAVLACLFKSSPSSSHPPFTMQTIFIDYVHGVGSAGLIILAFSMGRLGRMLSQKPLVWLGRVSYSLYLIHLPVIYIVSQTKLSTWPILPSSIIVISVSLILSEIMVRTIENPFIALGKRLANKQSA